MATFLMDLRRGCAPDLSGSTNLVAALVCPEDRSLYEYLTGDMTALAALTHIETAPVMRFVKMHATIAPP